MENHKNKLLGQEKPKKLSPEEEADLKKKRAKFREIYDWVSFHNAADGETELQMACSEVEAMYMKRQNTMLLKELGEPEGVDMRKQKLFEILSDITVGDTMNYLQAMQNAIRYHVREKSKEINIKDLGIKLLE